MFGEWIWDKLLANQGKNIFGTKGDFKGESVIIQTIEYVNGAPVQVWNKFRKYPTWEESLRDLANLYVNGTSWNRSLYTAVIGEQDYKKALKAIFDAGYASDPKYIEKLASLIETSDLTKYDESIEEVYHIVKKGIPYLRLQKHMVLRKCRFNSGMDWSILTLLK